MSLNGGDGLAVNPLQFFASEKSRAIESLSEEVGRDCRVPFQVTKSVVYRGSKCFDCSLISKIPCSEINQPALPPRKRALRKECECINYARSRAANGFATRLL